MTVVSPAQKTSHPPRPIQTLRGVGPDRAALLEKLEIRTVEDLLLHRPRRYEDRRHFRPIVELQMDEPAIARGKILALGTKWFRKHTKSIFEIILDDGTARLHCRWWNLPFMEKHFHSGDEVVVFGKLRGLKPRTMDHPETEVVESGEERFIHFGRITPIYPLTEGLPQRWLRGTIWRTLEECELLIEDPWNEDLNVPGQSAKFKFPSHPKALRAIHFPETLEEIEQARRRLALDEFVLLQKQIQTRRRNLQTKAKAIPCSGDNRLMRPFLSRLGFKLTDSQTKVLREIRKDLSGAHPMRRLLQGDVGSGKTVVAACSALMTLESGHNVALMAPTEILAEQHYSNFKKWFEFPGISVGLRTSTHKAGDSKVHNVSDFGFSNAEIRSEPERGAKSSLIIGTHALVASGFSQEDLGLVIIDEQHKFGVIQREEFLRKGRYPHLLVMTATPIPRTLGLTLYGDLDLSTIDHSPTGRGRIQTFVRGSDALDKVWPFVKGHLKEHRQVYVVYPRVEQTESDIKAVTRELDVLKRTLSPYRIGLVHGRVPGREKERVMTSFRNHEIDVLLATSLIEVGVDVPNATIMVIENAEQFGLAQLHQLRGRVGRGAQNSYCILVAAAKTDDARRRLQVMEETTDGFRIAEADLKLRGPGELLGQQQSGAPRFRFGDLTTDFELIQYAREVARQGEM